MHSAAVWYATRESVIDALDSRDPARLFTRVDEALAMASDVIEGDLHRRFYPYHDTRYFDYPERQGWDTWKLYLQQHEMIQIDTVTVAGQVLDAADWMARPDDGPPYRRIELNTGTSAGFSPGASGSQRAIAVAGIFGSDLGRIDTRGALDGVISDSVTEVDVTGPAAGALGVGSVIKVDDEHMIITDRSWLDIGETLAGGIGSTSADVALDVGASDISVGERLLIDAERMRVRDVTTDAVIVDRAIDGTPLAAHLTGAAVYVSRTMTVERGALGTSASGHGSVAVRRYRPPGLIEEWARALAVVEVVQGGAGWARVIGSGDNQQEAIGRGLDKIAADAWTRYARKARQAAI